MAETWVSWEDLATCVGERAAAALCAVHGGVAFYVPRAIPVACVDHWLASCLGPQAMSALIARFGGEYITVPNHRRAEPYKQRAIALLESGTSCRAVAMQLGLTERYVRRLARACRIHHGPRQCRLWDSLSPELEQDMSVSPVAP